jgi:hypothetical protein
MKAIITTLEQALIVGVLSVTCQMTTEINLELA